MRLWTLRFIAFNAFAASGMPGVENQPRPLRHASWFGARVAPQQSPILRPGRMHFTRNCRRDAVAPATNAEASKRIAARYLQEQTQEQHHPEPAHQNVTG